MKVSRRTFSKFLLGIPSLVLIKPAKLLSDEKKLKVPGLFHPSAYTESGQVREVDLSHKLEQTERMKTSAKVRRLVREKVVQFAFNSNDERTRFHLKDAIECSLENLKVDGNIENYHVVCDETNNPPCEVDKGRLKVDVFVFPWSGAKHISISAGSIPGDWKELL